jgi:hypothetical protein
VADATEEPPNFITIIKTVDPPRVGPKPRTDFIVDELVHRNNTSKQTLEDPLWIPEADFMSLLIR